MTIGQRIKIIREFRKLTQKELGIKCGFTESNADVRIRQYENNTKIPRKDTLMKIAEALDVNCLALENYSNGNAEDVMETLFWLEELCSITLFSLDYEYEKNTDWVFSGKYNNWNHFSVQTPIGIYINYNLVNEFMAEWMKRQIELKNKEISRNEYFEWKLNWPHTCDNCCTFNWHKE